MTHPFSWIGVWIDAIEVRLDTDLHDGPLVAGLLLPLDREPRRIELQPDPERPNVWRVPLNFPLPRGKILRLRISAMPGIQASAAAAAFVPDAVI